MKLVSALVAFALSTGVAAAATFNVFDHPEGNQTQNGREYGLRLEWVAGNVPESYWSFEDGSGNSQVKLSVDLGTGTGSVGGMMRRNSDSSLWTLSLTLEDVVSLAGIGAGAGSFGAGNFFGTLTNGVTTYQLDGKGRDVGVESYDWTYFSQNPGDGADFRLPNITAGWIGSVNGSSTMSRGTNDFIGVLAPVPVPAAGFLLVGALGALGLARRKRRS